MKNILALVFFVLCASLYSNDSLKVKQKKYCTLEINTALFFVKGLNLSLEIPLLKKSTVWFEINRYSYNYAPISFNLNVWGGDAPAQASYNITTRNFLSGYNYYFQPKKEALDGFYVGIYGKCSITDIYVSDPLYPQSSSYNIIKTTFSFCPQIGWQYCGKRGLILDFGAGAGASRLLKATHENGAPPDQYLPWLFDWRVNMGIGFVLHE